MIKTQTNFNIFAVCSQLKTDGFDNSSLCNDLVNVAVKGENLSNELLKKLSNADTVYTFTNKLNKSQIYSVNYYCVKNQRVISIFSHSCIVEKDSVFELEGAYTHQAFRKLGYGTYLYKFVIDDIFNKLNIKHITAHPISNSGKNLLKNFDFRIDECNGKQNFCKLIMFNPKHYSDSNIPENYVLFSKFLETNELSFDKDEYDGVVYSL